MKSLCEIPNCPAFAQVGGKTCAPHENARTAKALKICKDREGHGGKSCLGCKRRFTETDYVIATAERKKTRKGGEQFGYRHVACEPPTPRLSKKAIRESVKPLFVEAV